MMINIQNNYFNLIETCAENHAIATKIHAEYIRKLAESKYLWDGWVLAEYLRIFA